MSLALLRSSSSYALTGYSATLAPTRLETVAQRAVLEILGYSFCRSRCVSLW
jgi:hypothetical protein